MANTERELAPPQIIVVLLAMADTRNSAKFAFTHVSLYYDEPATLLTR